MASKWENLKIQAEKLQNRLSRLGPTICGTEQECQAAAGSLAATFSDTKNELDKLYSVIEKALSGATPQVEVLSSLNVARRLDKVRSRLGALEDGVLYALEGEGSSSHFAWLVFTLGVLILLGVFYLYIGLHAGKFSSFTEPKLAIDGNSYERIIDKDSGDKIQEKETIDKPVNGKKETGEGVSTRGKATNIGTAAASGDGEQTDLDASIPPKLSKTNSGNAPGAASHADNTQIDDQTVTKTASATLPIGISGSSQGISIKKTDRAAALPTPSSGTKESGQGTSVAQPQQSADSDGAEESVNVSANKNKSQQQRNDLIKLTYIRALVSVLDTVADEQAKTAAAEQANRKLGDKAQDLSDTSTNIYNRLTSQLADEIKKLKPMTILSRHERGHLSALQEEVKRETISPRVLGIFAEELSFAIESVDDGFFWETGAGRYAEVLFGAFFGVMVFALYNWWKFMPRPGRPRWAAWVVAKIFLALMASFVFVVLLSQISFTTPTSLTTGGAIGLGTAPIEMVFAVAILAGFFGQKAIGSLDVYTDRLFSSSDDTQAQGQVN